MQWLFAETRPIGSWQRWRFLQWGKNTLLHLLQGISKISSCSFIHHVPLFTSSYLLIHFLKQFVVSPSLTAFLLQLFSICIMCTGHCCNLTCLQNSYNTLGLQSYTLFKLCSVLILFPMSRSFLVVKKGETTRSHFLLSSLASCLAVINIVDTRLTSACSHG